MSVLQKKIGLINISKVTTITFAVTMPIMCLLWIPELKGKIAFMYCCQGWKLLSTEIVVSLILIMIYALWILKKAYISWTLVYFKAFVLAICLIPLSSETWQWHSMQSIIVITMVVMFLVDIVARYLNINVDDKCYSLQDDEFMRDCPIDDDDYNRHGCAVRLIKAIIVDSYKKNIKGAYTINVDEEYGRGKSSFFLLLEKELNNHDCIWFKFLPWRYSSSNKITEAFFTELENQLSPFFYIKELHLLNEYAKSVVEYTANKLGLSYLSLANEKSLSKQYEKISSIFSKYIKRPIVVLIDDVDRLKKDELWALLSLIRNTADFPYLYFVMASDRNYIKSTLSSVGNREDDVDFYLQKIINLNFLFPSVDAELLEEHFNNILKDLLMEKGIKDENIIEILNKIQGNIISDVKWNKVFTSFRDNNRFFSLFKMDMKPYTKEMFKTQVLAKDFVIIELVKFLRPDVFKILRDMPTVLLDKQPKDHRYVLKKECKDLVSIDITKILNKVETEKKTPQAESKVEQIKDFTDELQSRQNLVSKYVGYLLSEMFYDDINWQEERSIRRWDAFDFYFSLELHRNMITYTRFLDLFMDDGNISKQLPEIISNGQKDAFYHHLRQLLQHPDGIVDKIDCLSKMFKCLSISASKVEHVGRLTRFCYVKNEYEFEITNLDFSFFDKNSKYKITNKTEFFTFLRQDVEYIYYHALLVSNLIRFREESLFNMQDIEDMIHIVCRNAIEHIKGQNDPFNETDFMGYCAKNYGDPWKNFLKEYFESCDKGIFMKWLKLCLDQNSLDPNANLKANIFTDSYLTFLNDLHFKDNEINNLIARVIKINT